MVEQIRPLYAHFGKINISMDAHRLDFQPLAVFPVFAFLGDFADVDFRVEVGGKRLAVTAGVAVDNIDIVNLIEVVFLRVRAKDIRHPRIEAAAQQRHNAFFPVSVVISPLPLVLEFGHIFRLIIGGVEVIDARRQTRFHNG